MNASATPVTPSQQYATSTGCGPNRSASSASTTAVTSSAARHHQPSPTAQSGQRPRSDPHPPAGTRSATRTAAAPCGQRSDGTRRGGSYPGSQATASTTSRPATSPANAATATVTAAEVSTTVQYGPERPPCGPGPAASPAPTPARPGRPSPRPKSADRHGHRHQRPVTRIEQRLPRPYRIADHAARQPGADQVAVGDLLRREQAPAPSPPGVHLPAGK